MTKIIHTITLSGYKASVQGAQYLRLGTWDSYGIEQLQIVPGPEWTGLVIKAVFVTAAGTTPVVVPDSGLINVPPEATAQALGVESPGMIVFSGVTAGVQRITCNLLYLVSDHAPIDGTAPDPTPDQWAQFVAMVQQYAQQASQSATEAADSASAADRSATNAADSATQSAQSAAAAAKSAQDAAAELEKVQGAGSAALQAIGTAQSTAVGAVQDAQQAGVNAVQDEQSTATQAVQQVQQSAVQAVEQAGNTQVGSVNTAGQAQLDKINAANALVPTPTQEDAGKAIIVKPDGSGYELGDVQVDAYSKAESDARYAPIEAAIRPTVSGNPATLEHSVEWALQGLAVYGKSAQDGTPSPDNPVPIVSAGDAGSITVTVSDGADHSQQLIISTPNGLPGIPVPSGGNYTDADGQQWICDEVDFERGVYVKRTNQYTYDGTEKWDTWGVNYIVEGLTGFYCYFGDVNKNNINDNMPAYSSLLIYSGSVWGGREYGFGVSTPGSNQYIICTLQNNMLRDTSSDELAIQSWKEILEEKGMIVLCTLVDPVETPLTAEELAAYAALRTYDGTSIVATDAPVAGLSARYVADGAAYIDSKFAALSAAMLGG